MPKKISIADASSALFKLLEPFDSDERARIVDGTLTLLGESVGSDARRRQEDPLAGDPQKREPAKPVTSTAAAKGGAQKFFDERQPNSVSERLATAARFHELASGGAVVHKKDFAQILLDARRDFTVSQFARDIDNAKKAGLFRTGGDVKSGYTLSHVGQQYVDTLPDRKAARALLRAGRATTGGRRKARKKAKPKV
jgi:hypothetical protein